MTFLSVMRGLPASGKTTTARQLVEAFGAVRVCRDDIRQMLEGKDFLNYEGEEKVSLLEEAMVRAALKAGKSVVVDATHLRPRYVRKWAKVALELGADLDIREHHLTVAESVGRNAARRQMGQRSVPVDAILSMQKYLGKGDTMQPVDLSFDEQPAVRKYEPKPGTPNAIIVDIDGTLAHMVLGGCGFYDLHRVGEDLIDEDVRRICFWAFNAECEIILLSGREDSAREETVRWLNRHGVYWDLLFMRPADDKRKDSIVKAELFDKHVRDHYNVRFVLDDRNQVVEMWRAMGLKCFQVAEGAF